MESWKDLFRSHILERGLNYYIEGAVNSLERTETGYEAVVEGTEDYDVEIEIRDERICDMYCDCPYAAEGNYCKHMAAVLYAIEKEDIEENVPVDTIAGLQEKQNELRKLISKIPENELRNLVVSLAVDDEFLYNRLQTNYAEISPKQVQNLKNQVDEIAYRYSDRSGFIDYRNAWNYTSALREFLDEHVQVLIDKNYLKEAFEVTNYVFHEIGNCDMDDSGGESTEVASACYEFWKEILENCNKEQEMEMFQWFQKHQKSYVIDFMQDYMSDFLMDEFHNEEMLREKLRMIDEDIAKAGDKTDCGSSYSVHYGYMNNILKRMEIMEKLGCSEQEILDYRKKYRQFSNIRKIEIQEYLENENYEKAVEVLKESKVLDKNYAGLVADYSQQLIAIYEKTDQREEYKKELVYQVFEVWQRDLQYLQKLKEICGKEEWEEHREKFLISKKSDSLCYELMETEGLHERLLQKIKMSGSVYNLDKYEKVLKKHFSEEVRDMYINYVRNAAKRTGSRNSYIELMQYLKKIAKYEDGRQKAQEIAAEWRMEYKRRSAMLDELRKAGF